MEEVKKKVCSCCNIEKTIDDFNKRKLSPDGLSYRCRDCANTSIKKSQEKNRNKSLEEEAQKTQKTCSRCKEVKTVDHFSINNSNPDHLNYHCKECVAISSKLYKEKDRERYLQKARENYRKHLENGVRWRRENKVRLRELSNNYLRERRKTDLSYKIESCLRSRLQRAVKYQGVTKSDRTTILLGCTFQELRLHLESQFTEGMSWDNHGENGWEIDHKKPIVAFNLIDPEEQKKCFHYTNLQPLWRKDNRSKSSLHKGKRYLRKDLQP